MKARLVRLVLLLGCWLAAVPAWAQPAVAGQPAFVDSREECRTLGGAWVARDSGWQFACQVPWDRDECLRLGAAWTPLVGAPANGICIARVSDRATARQCTESGGSWGPPGSLMPFCQAGTARPVVAVRKAPDAGKKCDSQRDCTYGCIYQGPQKADGADVIGTCRADNARKGCFSMVEKGRLAGRICLD
jgi:hypothetical protein